MAEYKDREHFIPLRKSDLVELLSKDKALTAQEREAFGQFCRLVSAVFHFEYLRQLEDLKDAYAAFDPDADTEPPKPSDPEERGQRLEQLFENFTALMERANFKRLTTQEIEQTFAGASYWGVDVDVDLGVFDRLAVFVRGETLGERSRRVWWKLWRKERMGVPIHQRLVLILKLKKHRRIDPDIDTQSVFLKVFKDVPRMDRDMLLPGARAHMSRLDRALIAYPLAAGVALLLYNIGHSIWPALLTGAGAAVLVGVVGKMVTWSLAGAFGGYAYKSYYSYQVKRQSYSLRLTKSLYYQTLDSNAGVLMRLLDEAEEQECRETLLAYFCLWRYAPAQGWTAAQLDDYVERYRGGNAKLKVDFEVGDALAKLERLKIVEKVGDRYRAQPLARALEMLDWTWDNYWRFGTRMSPGASRPTPSESAGTNATP